MFWSLFTDPKKALHDCGQSHSAILDAEGLGGDLLMRSRANASLNSRGPKCTHGFASRSKPCLSGWPGGALCGATTPAKKRWHATHGCCLVTADTLPMAGTLCPKSRSAVVDLDGTSKVLLVSCSVRLVARL
jgi:hypothetical protein